MECAYRPRFVIIDLAAQASAFSRFVKGWSREQILAFLSRQGELERFPDMPGEEIFSFTSGIGFEALFFLNDDQFTFLGDHSTWRPK